MLCMLWKKRNHSRLPLTVLTWQHYRMQSFDNLGLTMGYPMGYLTRTTSLCLVAPVHTSW